VDKNLTAMNAKYRIEIRKEAWKFLRETFASIAFFAVNIWVAKLSDPTGYKRCFVVIMFFVVMMFKVICANQSAKE
jgi:hypothetical protein